MKICGKVFRFDFHFVVRATRLRKNIVITLCVTHKVIYNKILFIYSCLTPYQPAISLYDNVCVLQCDFNK